MFCSYVWFTLTTELLDRVLHDAQPAQPRGLAQSIMIHLTGSTSLHRIWIWQRVLKWPGECTQKCSQIWLRPTAICKCSTAEALGASLWRSGSDYPNLTSATVKIKHNLWIKIWNDVTTGRRPVSSNQRSDSKIKSEKKWSKMESGSSLMQRGPQRLGELRLYNK